MTLLYSFAKRDTPPLACDCLGAIVYIQLSVGYRSLTRDGHGVVRAKLTSRSQVANGSWNYSFNVDETGLVSPLPTLGSGMVEKICCQGCVGNAAEAYNMDEFGGRLVAADESLVAERIFVRHTIRSFVLSDWRAWVDTVSLWDAQFDLYVDGVKVTVNPLTIPAGSLVSDSTFSFLQGRSYRIPEGALIEIECIATGSGTGYYSSDPAALGLESWFFGHLNPSIYFSPLVALGSGPGTIVESYEALENAPVGSEFYDFPYIYKQTPFGIVRVSGDTSFTPP